MNKSNFDVSKLNLQVIDTSLNMSPDIYVNANCITFSKRAVEELGYPSYVQYSTDVENKVFGVKSCRGIDSKAVPFSKPKSEQTATISTGNKNVTEPVRALMEGVWSDKKRYKVKGFMIDSKTMIFVLPEGVEQEYRVEKKAGADSE